mmetsp:Transcript_5176/g.12447  ORF Transcript_5176/g.12447 Transcript_5176/m.12447 type:complete len:215 (-) Transcript_5176:1387-2031(-)
MTSRARPDCRCLLAPPTCRLLAACNPSSRRIVRTCLALMSASTAAASCTTECCSVCCSMVPSRINRCTFSFGKALISTPVADFANHRSAQNTSKTLIASTEAAYTMTVDGCISRKRDIRQPSGPSSETTSTRTLATFSPMITQSRCCFSDPAFQCFSLAATASSISLSSLSALCNSAKIKSASDARTLACPLPTARWAVVEANFRAHLLAKCAW